MRAFTIFFIGLVFTSKAQTFVDGLVVTHLNDSLSCKIIKNKSKKNDLANNYRFVTVIDSTGVEKQLQAKEIKAYRKEKMWYKSVNTTSTSFFLRQVVAGKVELFEAPPDSTNGLKSYYFKKNNSSEYFRVETDLTTTFYLLNSNSNLSTSGNYSTGALLQAETFRTSNDQKFIEFFSRYFSDCELVMNKIKAHLYSLEDLEMVFRDYNKCWR